jgi:hypothetical protein
MWRIKYANTPKLVAPFFCVDPTFPFQFPCKKKSSFKSTQEKPMIFVDTDTDTDAK